MNTSLIPGQRQSPDAITVRGLNKTYGLPKGGTLTAVDQLDLTIRAGETYALHLRTRATRLVAVVPTEALRAGGTDATMPGAAA